MLKYADVVPAVHKKKEKTINLSKIYEKLIYQQLYDNFDSILSPKHRFRKAHSTQHCFMVMPVKFKESRDRGDKFGVLFTDLFKAFYCTEQNRLITKLSWYRVTTKSHI